MVLPLSKSALASNEAAIEDRLRACGAELWPMGVLWRYQDAQQAKAFAAYLAECRKRIISRWSIGVTLLMCAVSVIVAFRASLLAGEQIFGFYLCGRVLIYLWGVPVWQTNILSSGDLYLREGRKERLPRLAQNLVDTIRLFFPRARFAVSFIGHDPILHVLLNGRSYAALVWEVNEDGSLDVVRSPAG